jgi:enoyl-CoA hydratase/carnithine racemase
MGAKMASITKKKPMHKIVIESRGEVALVRLANGVTNAIGSELLKDLSTVLADVKSGFRGMVLAGGNKFFSIGLDLPALLKLNRKDMAAFWTGFEDAVLALYTLPIPTAAAIAGHAPAAGTILALACDFRMIASGKKLMGLNEIKIGLPVPFLADLMLRQAVGDRAATEIEYTGELLMPEKAQALSLVDAIFPEEDVEAQAIAKISEMLERPPFGFPLTKQHRTRDIRTRFLADREFINQAFMDCWFSAPVQDILSEAAQKFR